MNTKPRFWISISFILWLTGLLAAFFIVQKPAWGGVLIGLGNLFATIFLWLIFVLASIGLGYFTFDTFIKIDSIYPYQRIVFSMGLGMGIFGLFGFLFAITGLGNQWSLLAVLLIVFYTTWHKFKLKIKQDFQNSFENLLRSKKYAPHWIPIFFVIIFSFSFLLALAPPIEAFDGLLYHLTVPALWLRDGSLQPVDLHPYWYPSLLEGMFVFPLAFHLDSAPQLIHWTFALLTVSFIFGWTQELFGSRVAWWSVALFISMPSIPWISAWAYTDLSLTFYALATLFTFGKWIKDSSNFRWLILSGIFCGFAVGIKYTIFSLPILTCLILFWQLKNDFRKLIQSLLYFVGTALLFGGIWYLRNFIVTGNPVYPFVFGGPNWDTFRAEWYANTGTGLGFDMFQLFLLPLTTTLGLRDETFFDGRIGPFYLILFPMLLVVIWKIYKTSHKEIQDINLLLLFGGLSIFFWVLGVIQTINLMQARLLIPGLIVLIPLFAKSILQLHIIDTSKFKSSFIFSTLMALTTFVFILDFGFLIFFRNPIMATIGVEPRQAYIERFNPSYGQLLTLAEKTPPEASIYLINEPRTYGINRLIQADANHDNLAHDFYLYTTNEELLSAWKYKGYSHVIVRFFVFDETHENQHLSARFEELRQMLIEIDKTEEYTLFQIP